MSFAHLARIVQTEPLTQWPKGVERTKEQKYSPFRASWSTTVEELARELRMLRADSIVLQMEFEPGQQRLDGLPYANAKVGASLVLSYEVDSERFMYPADTYLHWHDNLRAIALTLRALRAVDRYGVSKQGQQYSGWKAIPANVDEQVTPEEAAIVLLRTAGLEPNDLAVRSMIEENDQRREVYRTAARYSHPDRPGGTEAGFQRIQHAMLVLNEGD